MTEITVAEVNRRVSELNARIDNRVSKELFDLAIGALREDMAEVKAWQQRMTWALIGNFIGLVIGLVVFILNRGTI